MKYTDLAAWILTKLRPQEIYQPAAIICLVYRGGKATLDQIHEQLEIRRQERDPAAERRTPSETRRMPCQVLIDNGVIAESSKGVYELIDFDSYSPRQLTAIVAMCEDRIANWNLTRPPEG